MKTKIFINLTNGLEALERENISGRDINFIRIHSTHCEGKHWEIILQELDNNFLMWAANGYECIVYDYGSNHPVSKAVYMGLEWIKFVLNKIWLGKTIIPQMKDKQVFSTFEQEYRKLSKRTINKIEYYKKYFEGKDIRVKGMHAETDKDGDLEYYIRTCKEHI